MVALDAFRRHNRLVKFSVYLDDETGRKLAALARASACTRSLIVRRAIAAWLAGRGRGWPRVVIEFTGDPDMPAFESLRGGLRPPVDDPFAEQPARHRRRRRQG